MNLDIQQSAELFAQNLEPFISQMFEARARLFIREHPDKELLQWSAATKQLYAPSKGAMTWRVFHKEKLYAVIEFQKQMALDGESAAIIEALICAFVNYKYLRAQFAQIVEQQSMQQLALTSMSQELQNPIRGIMGATRILSQKLESSYLNTIMQCSVQLLECVNNILDYCRLKNGALQLNRAPMRLYKLVREVVDVAQVEAVPKHVTVQIRDAQQLLPQRYVGDATRVRQILQNVLQNAVRFSPEHSTVLLEVTQEPLADKLRFAIVDEGPGVSAAQQSSLFLPFASHGLGLVISKNLAEMMNGSLWYDKEYTRGARFLVELSLERQRENLDPAQIRGKSVLIVDDEFVVRATLVALARKWGMQPQLCASVEDAQLCLKEMSFDVVWIDTELPLETSICTVGLNQIGAQIGGAHFSRILEKPVGDYELLEATISLVGAPTITSPPPLEVQLSVLISSECDGAFLELVYNCTDIIVHSKVVAPDKIARWLERGSWDVVIVCNARQAISAKFVVITGPLTEQELRARLLKAAGLSG